MRFLTIFQVSVSILLILSILMQNRGSGLSGAFGGDQFGSYHTKRGFERFLFFFSITLSFLFLALALVNVFFRF